jgi:hypothetical protein
MNRDPTIIVALLGAAILSSSCQKASKQPAPDRIGAACITNSDCATGMTCTPNTSFAHQNNGATCEIVCQLTYPEGGCPEGFGCVPVISHGPHVGDGQGVCERQPD